MKRPIFFVGIAWVMLAVTPYVLALIREEQQEVLRRLEGVHVVVERLKPEIERDGLYASTLQMDVELSLRMAGIKVFTDEESLQATGIPDLHLKVNTLKCSNGYAYNLSLFLREKVMPLRRDMQVLATTLTIGDQLGIASRLSEIREELRDLIEEFVDAWQTANPR